MRVPKIVVWMCSLYPMQKNYDTEKDRKDVGGFFHFSSDGLMTFIIAHDGEEFAEVTLLSDWWSQSQ